jgi:ribonuclease P protein component
MPRNTYPKSHRLGGRNTFKSIKERGLRQSKGPLTGWIIPNDTNHLRLGISIGRHCGTAVRRNLVKRRIREAFRLIQHEFPGGFDLVLSVRPHVPLVLADYQQILCVFLQNRDCT